MKGTHGEGMVVALLMASMMWTTSCLFLWSANHSYQVYVGAHSQTLATAQLLRDDVAEKGRRSIVQETNQSSSSHDFYLRAADMIGPRIETVGQYPRMDVGHYSGMWWMTTACFLAHVHPQDMQTLEDASFRPFVAIGNEHVLMTHDWLDLAVEHLSRFVRQLRLGQDKVMTDILGILMRYMSRAPPMWPKETAFSHTLAVLPIMVDKSAWTDKSLLKLPNSTSEVPMQTRKNVLDMVSLAATLVSLDRVGMKRISVVGNAPDAPTLVKGAFRLARKMGCNTKNLFYQCPFQEAQAQVKNMPKVVLQALRLHHLNETDSTWFGRHKARYKYIYFSEPDLILHSRAKALYQMAEHLDQPICSVWTAHRFQPLPHEADFPSFPEVVPALGSLGRFQDVSVHGSDTCRDAGNHWPGRMLGHCGAPWYRCGLDATGSHQQRMKHLRRLFAYPMLRIMDGLGIPLVSEHARMCIPPEFARVV